MLVLVVSMLAGCGGLAVGAISPPVKGVPAPTSHGRGPWAFTVSFLARPTHTGVRTVVAAPGVVARDQYHARFKTGAGVGAEKVSVVEISHLSGGCILRSLLPGTGPCPKPHGDTLVRGVERCRASICHGYTGSVVLLRGKMVFDVDVIGASQTTVNAVLDSFAPHR